jgi:hypothetical protein
MPQPNVCSSVLLVLVSISSVVGQAPEKQQATAAPQHMIVPL